MFTGGKITPRNFSTSRPTERRVVIPAPRLYGNNHYTDHEAYKKAYGRRVAFLGKRYNLPFQIASVLGTNEDAYPVFVQLIVEPKKYLSEKTEKALRSSDVRYQRMALRHFLGNDVFMMAALDKRPEYIVERLSKYIISAFDRE